MKLALFTDGGARGNPGPAAWGYVIYQDEQLAAEGSGYLGHTTNNVAEYTACIEGLKHIQKNWGISQNVTCYADSQLMIEQICGRYKVKAPHLKPMIATIHELAAPQNITFKHIPREKNQAADALVNQVLDNQKKF